MVQKKRKIAILGTMNELGDESINAHKEVGYYAKDKVDLLIAIGKYKECYKDGFGLDNIITFEDKNEFIKNQLISILLKSEAGKKTIEENTNVLINIAETTEDKTVKACIITNLSNIKVLTNMTKDQKKRLCELINRNIDNTKTLNNNLTGANTRFGGRKKLYTK